MHRVVLDILGGIVLVRARHERLVKDVAEYFSANVLDELWRTPDVTVDCEWPSGDRRLFRARESGAGSLAGVRVRTLDGKLIEEWQHTNQIIPPVDLPPFKERFYALHAAAVSWPEAGRCLIVAGDKNSGKSTTAMELVGRFEGYLLSDETAVIHTRTVIVEPFLRPVHLWRVVNSLPVDKIPTNVRLATKGRIGVSQRVTHIAFLQPGTALGVKTIAADEAFDLALSHSVAFGSTLETALMSIGRLVREAAAAVVTYRGHAELLGASALLAEWCTRR